MITDIQLEWLGKIENGEITKKDDPHKWSVYMKRIREGIDHKFENLLWLAEHMPEILLDAEWEIQEFGVMKRRRLKALMIAIKMLYPERDVELIKLREDISFP